MKRLISVLFAVFLALSAVVSAFADAGPPPFKEFTVYVSNPLGAAACDYHWNEETEKSEMIRLSFTVPYGTELTVTGHYDLNGEEYGSVRYNKQYFYVKLSDVTFNNPVVGIEEGDKLGVKRRLAVIDKNGAQVYNGPGFFYEKVSEKIPYGTEFDFEYVDFLYDTSWAYVSVSGISGWVYINGNGFGEDVDVAYVVTENDSFTGKVLIVSEGTEITRELTNVSEKLDIKIPVGTELAFKYYYGNYIYKVFVEYNGQKGWMTAKESDADSAAIMGEKGGVYILADKLSVYDKPPVDSSSKKVGEIKGNSSLAVDYRYFVEDFSQSGYVSYDFCRISIDGKNYWISETNGEMIYTDCVSEFKIIAANGVQMYSGPSRSSEKLSVIPKGTTVNGSYWKYSDDNDWRFVEYNGVGGWIIENDNIEYIDGTEKSAGALLASKAEFVKEKPVSTTKKAAATTQKPTETVKTENITTTAVPVSETTVAPPAELTTVSDTSSVSATEQAENSSSPKTIIIVCVAGAAVIALTAAVTITLVNKKKKER